MDESANRVYRWPLRLVRILFSGTLISGTLRRGHTPRIPDYGIARFIPITDELFPPTNSLRMIE
jgi:hypothetical protein